MNTQHKRAYTKAWKARNRETVRRQANDRNARKRFQQMMAHQCFLAVLKTLNVVYW
jgi:hypothetical protein